MLGGSQIFKDHCIVNITHFLIFYNISTTVHAHNDTASDGQEGRNRVTCLMDGSVDGFSQT